MFSCDGLIAAENNWRRHLQATVLTADTSSLVKSNISRKMFDDHLWFSVFNRKRKSKFSRLQRLSCCLSILFLTMISNAMWYKTDNTEGTPEGFQIGPIRITAHELYTSFMSSLIVVPPVLIITALFANSAAQQEKKSRKNKYETKQNRSYVQPEERRKKKRELPNWCIYIAYSLCGLSVVASGFFTILYAMEWGRETANAWLTSFLLSFFQSVLIIQPIKVSYMLVQTMS